MPQTIGGNSRTKVRIPHPDRLWDAVDTWAKKLGYRCLEQDSTRRLYQKGRFWSAPKLFFIKSFPDEVQIEAWLRFNKAVQASSLAFLPPELPIEPGGMRAIVPKQTARRHLAMLLQELGAEPPRSIVLFDGVCNLCNASVQFIVDRDPKGHFRFASLQSSFGTEVLQRFGMPTDRFHSLVLYENNQIYTQSSAALRIASRLSGPWKLSSLFIVVPKPLRDLVYNWVSRNRYRWFGRSETCRTPDPKLRSRFIEGD